MTDKNSSTSRTKHFAGSGESRDAAEATDYETRALGDFRIIRQVGRGGMGAVFEAEQISLKRRVALKILRFGAASDQEAIERFQREAETIATLHHTNIVPIFAVGSEQGVNYYAMQFIEGQSLAEIIKESHGALEPHRVAAWALTCADALDHAHKRGVIHRDVKPSNLLLDHGERLWLTDFGLARRVDDVSLSITGALLGTPRYMSPEQADANASSRIDHRSDLFSLGATMYELLTGQPAFDGETPHEVLRQIRESDPLRPRQINKSIPRDLETIVIRCLAKDPARRYSTAKAVADDLRAFLDGRPIRARRAGPLEWSQRWLRKRKQTVTLSTSAAAITLLLVLVGVVGWLRYDNWRQAAVQFGAATPPLVAEILNARNELVRIETAPTQEAAQLPAGEYKVRVSGSFALSQTYELGLDRGDRAVHTLNLHDQLLWLPTPFQRAYSLVDFDDEQALVMSTDEGTTIRKRKPPLASWSLNLSSPPPVLEGSPGFHWPWTTRSVAHSSYGTHEYQPWFAHNSLDVDEDGMRDLICAARHQAWVMAISGRDGQILWFAPRGEDLRHQIPDNLHQRRLSFRSSVLGDPIVSMDCDGDGVNDIIATMIDVGSTATSSQLINSAKRWVEAISGKTGKTLWSHDLPAELFEVATDQTVPRDLRWYPMPDGALAGGSLRLYSPRHITRELRRAEYRGPHVYRPTSAELVTLSGKRRVVLVAGTHLIQLDPNTGSEIDPPVDLNIRVGHTPQWADVDGDGSLDLVSLEEAAESVSLAAPTARLVVWSPIRMATLWSTKLAARWPQRSLWTVEAPRWPVIADLDSDGKSEVIVPAGTSATGNRAPNSAATPWGKIAVFAGANGQKRWERRVPSMDSQIDHCLVGPDLDRDGHRELFVASLSGSSLRVWVDALSGTNGHTLWSSHYQPKHDSDSDGFVLAPPKWWRNGTDGWPQLVIHLVQEQHPSGSLVAIFSAGNGRLSHLGNDVSSIHPADVDRDGLQDLLVVRATTPVSEDLGGNLYCLRGSAGELWRRLGEFGEPTVDLDGDGVQDLVQSLADGRLSATSGLSGKRLWQTSTAISDGQVGFRAVASAAGNATSPSKRLEGDLNGDGTPDLLAWQLSGTGRKSATFFAVSGRDGRRLWTVSEVLARVVADTLAVEAQDLDGDGNVEVLWLAALDYRYPDQSPLSGNYVQLWLFVTSGKNGKLQWSRALSPAYGLISRQSAPFSFGHLDLTLPIADLNGDGIQDVLVPSISANEDVELLAIGGQNGQTLWNRPRAPDRSSQNMLENWSPPLICDLEDDGQVELILIEPAKPSGSAADQLATEIQVTSLAAKDGTEKWTYHTGARVSRWLTASGKRIEVSTPRVTRIAGETSRVNVYLPNDKPRLVSLNASGHAQEYAMLDPTRPVPPQACDVDGDGTDELIIVERSTIRVVSANRMEEPLWTRTLGTGMEPQILGLWATKDQGPVIAVALDGTDNSVWGLEALSGKTVWCCPGPIPRDVSDGVFMVPRHIALLTSSNRPRPLVYYAHGSVAQVRRAARLNGHSLETHAAVQTEAETDLPAWSAENVSRTDERWSRDLPWRLQPAQTREVIRLVGWSVFFSVLLLISPAAYLVFAVVGGQVSLRTLMLLPVVAAGLMLAVLMPVRENDFSELTGRFVAAVLFAPAVVFAGLMLWWLANRRWKQTFTWIIVSALVAVICGAVSLGFAARHSPLLLEERYDLSGWYAIWIFGAYLTAWIALAQLVVQRVAGSWLMRSRAKVAAKAA